MYKLFWLLKKMEVLLGLELTAGCCSKLPFDLQAAGKGAA